MSGTRFSATEHNDATTGPGNTALDAIVSAVDYMRSVADYTISVADYMRSDGSNIKGLGHVEAC